MDLSSTESNSNQSKAWDPSLSNSVLASLESTLKLLKGTYCICKQKCIQKVMYVNTFLGSRRCMQIFIFNMSGCRLYQHFCYSVIIAETAPDRSLPHSVPAVPEKPVTKKGKGKTCINVPASINPLDQTCIHPESYHVAQRYCRTPHFQQKQPIGQSIN